MRTNKSANGSKLLVARFLVPGKMLSTLINDNGSAARRRTELVFNRGMREEMRDKSCACGEERL